MGFGKTEKLLDLFDSYSNNERVVIATCKRSLCAESKKNFGFKGYNDEGSEYYLKEGNVCVQIDSFHRVVGKVHTLVLDEWIDLSAQLNGSKNYKENFERLRYYVKNAEKVIVMDANLSYDRNLLIDMREKDDFHTLWLTNKCHTDKKVIVCSKLELERRIVESVGTCYIPCDTKTDADYFYSVYVASHPDVPLEKIHLRTSDSSEEDREVNLDDMFCVITSPSITAGISVKRRVDNVFASYSCQTITAESASQQLFRFRNWDTAYINIIPTFEEHKTSVDDVDKELEHRLKFRTHKGDFLPELDVLNGEIIKDDRYIAMLENLVRQKRSRVAFYPIFVRILEEHGVSVSKSEDKDNSVNWTVREQAKEVDEHRKTNFYTAIATCEPTKEEKTLFENGKGDKIKRTDAFEHLSLKSIFGLNQLDEKFVETYLDRKEQFQNVLFFNEEDNEVKNYANEMTSNAEKLRFNNRIDKRRIALLLLNKMGFSGPLDKESHSYDREELRHFVKENQSSINLVFGISPKKKKTEELNEKGKPVYKVVETDFNNEKVLSEYVNHKINEVFGITFRKFGNKNSNNNSAVLTNSIWIAAPFRCYREPKMSLLKRHESRGVCFVSTD